MRQLICISGNGEKLQNILEIGHEKGTSIKQNKCFTNFILFLVEAACEALTDMPPRGEEELDAVTLHNQALMNMESEPTQGFEKLQFLLQQNPFPPETFGNLLVLYVKYEVWLYATNLLNEPVC